MSVYVVPQALKLAKQKIVREHQKIGKNNYDSVSNDELKQLVEDVVRQKESRIHRYAEILDDAQIKLLCEYICNNIYQKDCTNIFEVIACRATEEGFQFIYRDWQNHCGNHDVRSFICKQIETNFRMQKAVNDFGLETQDILLWIKEDEYLRILGKVCSEEDEYTDVRKVLKKYGVCEDTMLEKDCMRKFILFCTRNAYLSMQIEKIVGYFNVLYTDEKEDFIVNFLSKLSLRELIQYMAIYHAICGYMSTQSVKQKILDKLERLKLLQKFLQWEKAVKLRESLEDQERFEFWMEYVLDNELYDMRESMYIDFGDIVVTEFKGKAAGPAYFYKKQYFNAHIKGRMMTMNKTKFATFQFSMWNKKTRPEGVLNRLIHQPSPGWEPDFRYELRRHGIIPNNR